MRYYLLRPPSCPKLPNIKAARSIKDLAPTTLKFQQSTLPIWEAAFWEEAGMGYTCVHMMEAWMPPPTMGYFRFLLGRSKCNCLSVWRTHEEYGEVTHIEAWMQVCMFWALQERKVPMGKTQGLFLTRLRCILRYTTATSLWLSQHKLGQNSLSAESDNHILSLLAKTKWEREICLGGWREKVLG